jgi:hypothetical protein
MGLLPKIIGTINPITTTPSNIDSTGYYYHHITINWTSAVGVADIYEIIVYKYDPSAAGYVRQMNQIVDYVSTTQGTDLSWELNPTPGDNVRITVAKISGANGSCNYEIIRAA